jgi:hypothetical protein
MSTQLVRKGGGMKTFVKSKSARILLLAGVGLALTTAGVGAAIAANSGNVDSGITGKTWTDLGAEQFGGLPSGTRIVDCSPSQKTLEPGTIASRAPGFLVEHPGFHFLIDGRCALDPNAVSTPMRTDSLDSPTP